MNTKKVILTQRFLQRFASEQRKALQTLQQDRHDLNQEIGFWTGIAKEYEHVPDKVTAHIVQLKKTEQFYSKAHNRLANLQYAVKQALNHHRPLGHSVLQQMEQMTTLMINGCDDDKQNVKGSRKLTKKVKDRAKRLVELQQAIRKQKSRLS